MSMRVPPSVEPTASKLGSETQEGVRATPTKMGPGEPSIPPSTEWMDAMAFEMASAPMMSFRHGFYYNTDGIKHTCHDELGSYTYKESASIDLQDPVDCRVSPTAVDAMINQAYEGTTSCTMEEDD